MAILEETLGKHKIYWRDYISWWAYGRFGIPLELLVEVAIPATRQDEQMKMSTRFKSMCFKKMKPKLYGIY